MEKRCTDEEVTGKRPEQMLGKVTKSSYKFDLLDGVVILKILLNAEGLPVALYPQCTTVQCCNYTLEANLYWYGLT